MKVVLKIIPVITFLLTISLLSGQVNSPHVKLYGFVRAEMIYDNTEIVQGDWLLYISNSENSMKRQVFTMTGRHSRLGLKISKAGLLNNMNINGLIEFDFAGGFPNSSTAARQPLFRMRHAWIELVKNQFSVRFGQDWALISTPFPSTTSFVIGAGTGNLWMRYPQLSVTYNAGSVKIAGSLNRPMAGNIKYNDYGKGDLDPLGDGEITGRPWYMGRIWLKMLFGTVSSSGHYGHEIVKDLSGTEHQVSSWSINFDLVTSIGPVNFTSRVFTGENLNSFFGGVFQGYISDSLTVTSLSSRGGWLQGSVAIFKNMQLTGGVGLDDPEDGILPSSARGKNSWKYANIKYQFDPSLSILFEIESLTTSYKNDKDFNGVRYQMVCYLKF